MQLLKYLRPQYAAFHMRAVSLLWQLERATKSSHLESIVAQSISVPGGSQDVQVACEAFGVLWRLTGILNNTEYNISRTLTSCNVNRGRTASRLPVTSANDACLGYTEK